MREVALAPMSPMAGNPSQDPFFDLEPGLWSQPATEHTSGRFGLIALHGRAGNKEFAYARTQLDEPSDYEEEEKPLNLGLSTPTESVNGHGYGASMSMEESMEKRVLRKVSWHLLARFFLLTFMCYLDRTNLSFASLQMNKALGFNEAVYGTGSGLFYVGYFFSQLPSNMVLQSVGAPIWLSFLVAAWGIIAMCFAFVQTAWQFYVVRILLGLAEGGTFPGQYYHLSCFFNDQEMGVQYSYVLLGIAVSQVLGAPIAALIFQMDGLGGLKGYQWLFILEGIPTVLLAVWLFMSLAKDPDSCSFLTPSERDWLVSRCKRQHSSKAQEGRPDDLQGAVRDFRTWWLSASGFMYTVAKYSIMYFCPLIIQSVIEGHGGTLTTVPRPHGTEGPLDPAVPVSPAAAGAPSEVHVAAQESPSNTLVALLTTLPYLAASIVLVANTWHSKITGETLMHVMVPMAVSTVAFMLLPLMMRTSVWLTIMGLMLSTVCLSGEAIWMSWMAACAHGGGLAASVAIINSIGNLGGLAGNVLLGYLKTHLPGGYAVSMPILGSFLFVSTVSLLFFYRCLPVRKATIHAFQPIAQDDEDVGSLSDGRRDMLDDLSADEGDHMLPAGPEGDQDMLLESVDLDASPHYR